MADYPIDILPIINSLINDIDMLNDGEFGQIENIKFSKQNGIFKTYLDDNIHFFSKDIKLSAINIFCLVNNYCFASFINDKGLVKTKL